MREKNQTKSPAGLTDTTRRRVLKGITIGGSALTISEWSRPVVQSIVLPAHANGSPTNGVMAEGFDAARSTTAQIIWQVNP